MSFTSFKIVRVMFLLKCISNITKAWYVIGLFPLLLQAQFVEDVYNKYTSVNQLGMTVTNIGLLGNGWNTINGQILPSCQYKQHTETLSEQVEHFSHAGLWIGGIVNGEKRVSTAIVDGVFDSGQEGFEFFANSGIRIRSSISQDSMAQYFSPDAISHQDFLTDFRDYGNSVYDSNGVPNHNPLGIDVHLESYAWDNTFADAFVILNYQITNTSNDTIQDIFTGIWTDASVGNMNYTSIYEQGGGFVWYDNLNGFDESMDESGFSRDIAYQYDADGDDGWSESYIGISCLGGTVPRQYLHSNYHQWVWTNSNNSDYPEYTMPINDFERYEKMTSSVQKGNDLNLYTDEGYPASPNSWLFMISAGPSGSVPVAIDSSSWALPPGDSCNIVFAVIAARWNGSEDDSPDRRSNLKTSADRAQITYSGEDINRNNVLDTGEDRDGDNEIDRYLLPANPPYNVTADWNYPAVTLSWEPPNQSVIGYNIYRSQYNSEYIMINSSMIADTFFVDLDVTEELVTAYYVKSINDVGLESTPSNTIKDYSAPPSISFQYRSNPSLSDIESDTNFTFPTRTFAWDLADPDGLETITHIYYALDDTTGWIELPGNQRSLTLENIPTGSRTFYLKAQDNFGLYSRVISFPDSSNHDEPDYWEVMPVRGNVLLVDDFVQDNQNNAQNWYRSILDTVVGIGNYSVWEIGNKLPKSAIDVTANLNYFDHVIWYSAFVGRETYLDASSSMLSYIMGGGNLFLNVAELKDSTFTWFPLASSTTLNPSGRIFAGRTLMSQVNTELDLETTSLISIRIKSFEPDATQFANVRSLYQLQEPGSYDEWVGTPNVCSVGQFLIPTNQLLSGEIVLMSMPLHNGSSPLLDGNGSASKFIQYLLTEEFSPRPVIDPVYPGDTDNNGIVDALDILPIGIYFLQEGLPRDITGVSWTSYEIPLWKLFPSTYADANGEGIVDEKDVIAIGVNWFNTHTVSGSNTFIINPMDMNLLVQHRSDFQKIYNSLAGESEAVKSMKKLLESILDIQIPMAYSLNQNYPNPFNPVTSIRFGLPDAQSVTLIIYNLLGQVIEVLLDNNSYEAGFHEIEFDANQYSSGVYFYRIEAGEWSATRKMVAIK